MTTSDRAVNIARAVLAKCAGKDPWFPNPSDAVVLGWAEQFEAERMLDPDLLSDAVVAIYKRGGDVRPLAADIIIAAISRRLARRRHRACRAVGFSDSSASR